MTPDQHIDKIVDGVEASVIAGANNASAKLIDELPTWFAKNSADTKGLITKLDAEMARIIKSSTYPKAVLTAVRSLEDIQKYSFELLADYNPGFDPYTAGSRLGIDSMRELAVDTLAERLTTQDVKTLVLDPIRRAIIQNVQGGASTSEVKKFLIDALTKHDKTNKLEPFARHASQIAMDSVLGWDGQIYDRFRTEYEVNEIRYIGSLINDSRPQCVRWVRTYSGKIPIDKLQAEINWAKTSGSGMKQTTTVSTFCTDRGGWHCRHKAIPIFINQDDNAK
jgi:hypothetical protein